MITYKYRQLVYVHKIDMDINIHKKFYDGISLLFTLWCIPLLLLAILVFSNGTVGLIFSTILLGVILITLLPLIFNPNQPFRLYEFLGGVSETVSAITPQQLALGIFGLFIAPAIIIWITFKLDKNDLNVNTHQWNKFSFKNILQTIYQTVHFGPKPSTTAVTVEDKFTRITFNSEEEFEDWLASLEPSSDSDPCGLCEPIDYSITNDPDEIEHICNDCLRETVEQIETEKELQVADVILASRI